MVHGKLRLIALVLLVFPFFTFFFEMSVLGVHLFIEPQPLKAWGSVLEGFGALTAKVAPTSIIGVFMFWMVEVVNIFAPLDAR